MLKCGIWRKLGGGIFNCLGCFKTAATVQNFILMALHADWKHYRRPGVFPLPVPLARSYGCTAWCLKAASSLLHKAWRARRCPDVHLQHRSPSLSLSISRRLTLLSNSLFPRRLANLKVQNPLEGNTISRNKNKAELIILQQLIFPLLL